MQSTYSSKLTRIRMIKDFIIPLLLKYINLTFPVFGNYSKEILNIRYVSRTVEANTHNGNWHSCIL